MRDFLQVILGILVKDLHSGQLLIRALDMEHDGCMKTVVLPWVCAAG